MIGALSAYIKNIIGLIIMTALAEIIIPSGSLKKYIRLGMGLIIIASVTEPAVKLIWKHGYDFNMDVNEIYAYGEDYYKDDQKRLAEDIYKEEMEKIFNETAVSMGIEVMGVDIQTDGTYIKTAHMYIKKPHSCVSAVAGFNGEKSVCETCEEERENLRNALIIKTGIENISIDILED